MEEDRHYFPAPIPENVQSQTGWGSEQTGLEEGVTAQGRGLEPDDLQGPLQPKPVCHSMTFFVLLNKFSC